MAVYHIFINVVLLFFYVQLSSGLMVLTWSRVGTQGDDWKHGQMHFNQSSGPVTIIFEAVRGAGYQGDIAIDDIDFTRGAECPASRECTFEKTVSDDGTCGWKQEPASSKKDQFDWTRAKGSTASIMTGPKTDHTLQTSEGHYFLIIAFRYMKEVRNSCFMNIFR